jgi:hypothetical protein
MKFQFIKFCIVGLLLLSFSTARANPCYKFFRRGVALVAGYVRLVPKVAKPAEVAKPSQVANAVSAAAPASPPPTATFSKAEPIVYTAQIGAAPTKLEFNHHDTTGPHGLVTTYRENMPSDSEKVRFVLWKARERGRFADVNGRHIVAARIYEHFDYSTSEPRIHVINGSRVVLSKDMSGYRTIEGLEVRDFSFSPDNLSTVNREQIHLLRLVAMLLGHRFVFYNSTFQYGQNIGVSHFSDALSFNDGNSIDAILASVPVKWLSAAHPWHSIDENDIILFKTRLAQLTDETISAIVKEAELGNIEREQTLIRDLIARRDTMMRQLTVVRLTSHPTPAVIELSARLRTNSKIERTFDNTKQKQPPPLLSDEQKRNLADSDRAYINDYVGFLKAFINDEIYDLGLVTFSYHQLLELESFGFYDWDVNLLTALFDKYILLIGAQAVPNDDALADDARQIVTFGLRHKTENIVRSVADSVIRHFHKRPQNLAAVLWRLSFAFSDDFKFYIGRSVELRQHAVAEILLQSIITTSLDEAELYDLNSAGADRINQALDRAIAAIDIFLKAGVQRSDITQPLDLQKLAAIIKSIKYYPSDTGTMTRPALTVARSMAPNALRINLYDWLRNYIMLQLQGQSADLPTEMKALLDAGAN